MLCSMLQMNQRLDLKLLLQRNQLLATEMRLKRELARLVFLELVQECEL